MNPRPLSRREFLKLAAAGAGSLALPHQPVNQGNLPAFPQAEKLGRAAKGSILLKAKPDPDSQTLNTLYEDAVVPWLREVIGERPNYVYNNQRWVETPDGFVYGPTLQPVRYLPNEPVSNLPTSSRGPGMWVEVTVPYVDVILENQPTSNSWVEVKVDEGLPLRFYYGQVFWVDQVRTNERGAFYRVNPNYYGGVDLLWGAAEAFRPIQAEELTPIRPEETDKRVVVDVNHQMLSCFEGNSEVFYCRVSTGAKFDMYGNVVDKWSTPVGQHRVTRKYISLQMSGGATGAGYDLPGIGWSAIFATGGVAVHSTFWHNNFGDPMSHGCVNVLPEDAKWLFRWTQPNVAFDPGMEDVTLSGAESTSVVVVEG
jgi:lipoprotein-anchoring transpeptidase ErfK/SrfK